MTFTNIPIANITVHGKRLNAFLPLRIRKKAKMAIFITSIQYYTKGKKRKLKTKTKKPYTLKFN